ncbi:hypothetical protein KIN20_032448 [Parelaphostrongylus tenuis]|uniref:Uncharacterized protein n=1 Tax=Parelaphostrongylus tenuis TaxID=148309 RepID=A0AAD5R6K9_PARTN|nr:hypothetical protein KIN20_032448 [Parelaphostrongylus tenuis]
MNTILRKKPVFPRLLFADRVKVSVTGLTLGTGANTTLFFDMAAKLLKLGRSPPFPPGKLS